MEIDNLLKEIQTHLNETDDLSLLADWDHKLSLEYAFIATHLADVKKKQAGEEITIKLNEMRADPSKKITETQIQRLYYASENGQYNAYATEMLKGIAKLISAIRFKRDLARIH